MTRRLLLDVQACQNTVFRERGLARYVAGHADALVATGRVGAVTLNTALPGEPGLTERVLSSGLVSWETATNYRRAVGNGHVAYYVMSPFENLLAGPIVPPYVDVPLVVTLFDLIPLVMPERYLSNPAVRDAYETRLSTVRRADLVLAISESTRNDAIAYLGVPEDKVAVIGGGVDTIFTPSPAGFDPVAAARACVTGLRADFALCVSGAYDDRKNIDGLLAAWSRLGDARGPTQLVIVCALSESERDRWEAQSRRVGLTHDDVIFTGLVSDDALVDLYRGATVCIAPSVYEGFGLPVAEAAACGTATLGARASSFPELIGDPEALFDPADPDDMATVLVRALRDDAWRNRLATAAAGSAHRFRWQEVAARTIAAIDSTLVHQRRAPRQARLALFTTLPASEALVTALSRICFVDVFVEGKLKRVPTDPASVARFSVDVFERRFQASWYDAVVYALEATADCANTLRIAARVPGVVWLRDDFRDDASELTRALADARAVIVDADRTWTDLVSSQPEVARDASEVHVFPREPTLVADELVKLCLAL
jgi:glycosyltransferase involved in cell wall biosynthesis